MVVFTVLVVIAEMARLDALSEATLLRFATARAGQVNPINTSENNRRINKDITAQYDSQCAAHRPDAVSQSGFYL